MFTIQTENITVNFSWNDYNISVLSTIYDSKKYYAFSQVNYK